MRADLWYPLLLCLIFKVSLEDSWNRFFMHSNAVPFEVFISDNWILCVDLHTALQELLVTGCTLLLHYMAEPCFMSFWILRITSMNWTWERLLLFAFTFSSFPTASFTSILQVLLLRERLDKTDWCPKCKRKDQKGPFLISLEGWFVPRCFLDIILYLKALFILKMKRTSGF